MPAEWDPSIHTIFGFIYDNGRKIDSSETPQDMIWKKLTENNIDVKQLEIVEGVGRGWQVSKYFVYVETTAKVGEAGTASIRVSTY